MMRIHDFLVRFEKVERLAFNYVFLAKLVYELFRKDAVLQFRGMNPNVVLPCSVILELQSEIVSLYKEISLNKQVEL